MDWTFRSEHAPEFAGFTVNPSGADVTILIENASTNKSLGIAT
jgi:hypothetical protein